MVAVAGLVRRQSRLLSAGLILAIFGLLIRQLLLDWHNVPAGFFSSVRYPLLLASLAALVPSLLLVSLRWSLTLRAMGTPIGWWSSVQIWFLSQASRYLPGGIWTYVSRFWLGREAMAQEALVTSMVLETGLRVVSEVLVFLVSIPLWTGGYRIGAEATLLLIAASVSGLILVHPQVLDWLGRTSLAHRVGIKPMDLSKLRYGTVLALLAYYMLTVLLVGAAFYLLVAALYPLGPKLLIPLAGSLSLSVVLGFLTPLAPNGWGVREGVLAFLLSQMMPPAVAIVVSAAARIWLGLGEAAWIAVALLARRIAAAKKAEITQKGY
jgi:uncharacterized membrane protein YbhN (UPF0104 family)